jgi:hypothetical protein
LYYFNCGPHSFCCSIFALNSFYEFIFPISPFCILLYFILFYFNVRFGPLFLIDIYFVFHPFSNWFSFQFHTWLFF